MALGLYFVAKTFLSHGLKRFCGLRTSSMPLYSGACPFVAAIYYLMVSLLSRGHHKFSILSHGFSISHGLVILSCGRGIVTHWHTLLKLTTLLPQRLCKNLPFQHTRRKVRKKNPKTAELQKSSAGGGALLDDERPEETTG